MSFLNLYLIMSVFYLTYYFFFFFHVVLYSYLGVEVSVV